jgi:hypothetical protein
MKFSQALEALKQGKLIARSEWKDVWLLLLIDGRVIEIALNEFGKMEFLIEKDEVKEWNPLNIDLISEDWKFTNIKND